MPFTVTSFETTPNPDAMKCLVAPSPTTVPRSYFDAASAGDDPLASALFAIDGVTNVLIHTEFVTVCKAPGTRWAGLKSKIERALRDAD
jgi:hypothetical protein